MDYRHLIFLIGCWFLSCSDKAPQRVKLEQGTNMALALSPDKELIAIDLQGTIWLLPTKGGEARPITGSLADCHEPAWSPDGQWLAFHSYTENNYHIWKVNKDGSDLEQLTFGPFDDREPAWSTDGNEIVFSSDRNGNYDLWKLQLSSKSIMELTNTTYNEYHPVYCPEGNHIAYVSENSVAPGIYILDTLGSTELVETRPEKLNAPSWNPNHREVIYSSYDRIKTRLHLRGLANGKTEIISENEDVFPFKTSWPNEHSILYTADGRIKKRDLSQETTSEIPFYAQISLLRPAYQRKAYHFDDSTEAQPLGIRNPVISPSGEWVAFTALSDIWLQEISGDSMIAITQDPAVDLDPAWSPDGNKLVFASDRGGQMDLWIKDLNNNKLEQITRLEKPAGFPSWSPDGRSISFLQREALNVWGQSTLHILDLDSKIVSAPLVKYFVPSKPDWSPDSKRLVLSVLSPASSRYREGISKFLTINVEDSSKQLISPKEHHTPSIRNVNGPLWSPDGNSITYVQNGLLWRLPIDSGDGIKNTPEALTSELTSSPSWTNDGRILYLATDHLKLLDPTKGQASRIELDLKWKPQFNHEDYVICAGRIFNGKENAYRKNVDILIKGHRIERIQPHISTHDVEVIDASQYTIIPGLFEMHSHQHSSVGERLGRSWLAYGITSVREPGADPYDALERKEAWSGGFRWGPREFFTGGLTDGSRIYYGLANSVTTQSHLSMELDRADRLGYDLIKTYVRMPDSMQKQIVEAAHSLGIPVSSHELYPAAAYNVDAIEHMLGTSRRGYSNKQTALNKTYSDVIRILARSQMNITPTICMQNGFFIMTHKDPSIWGDRQFTTLYSQAYRDTLKLKLTQYSRPEEALYPKFEAVQEAVTAIVHEGGRVTAGTDSPFLPYGLSLHVEMQLFVDGGLSPFQALQSATINAAEAIGVDKDLGSIEPGKLADLVIIDGDPLSQISDTRKVVTTIKNGIRYDLDGLLKGYDE